jgi:hypothetical protein
MLGAFPRQGSGSQVLSFFKILILEHSRISTFLTLRLALESWQVGRRGQWAFNVGEVVKRESSYIPELVILFSLTLTRMQR